MLKNRLLLVPSSLESQIVVETLNPFLTINKSPYTVHKAHGGGEDLLIVECGVGPNLAGAALAWAAASFSLSEAILVGVAGLSPDSDKALGDLVSVEQVYCCRLGGMRNGKFEGIDKVLPLASFNRQVTNMIDSCANRLDLPTVRCASSEYISRDTEDLEFLRQFEGVEIEAMETAGLAQVATLMNLPWFEFRALSNYWGISDHRLWKWDDCKQQLARVASLIADGPVRQER